MTIYLKGFLLGMTLQLSVGPVFFALLHKSLKEGFAEGIKMTLGVALVDALYIALSFTAISRILEASDKIEWLVRLIGAIVLFYFAFGYFKRAGKQNTEVKVVKSAKSFYYGLKLTIINPLSIVFWTGTFGAVVASGMVAEGSGILIYAGGCVSATLFFLTGASFLASRVQGFLTEKVMRNLDRVVGAFLFIFAASLLIK